MFPRVSQILGSDQQNDLAPKITGMLVDLSVQSIEDIINLLQEPAKLQKRVG